MTQLKAKRKASQEVTRAQEIQATMTEFADAHNANLREWPGRVETAAREILDSEKLSSEVKADIRMMIGLASCCQLHTKQGDHLGARHSALQLGMAIQRLNSRYTEENGYFMWRGVSPVKVSQQQRALLNILSGQSRVAVSKLLRAGCVRDSDSTLNITALRQAIKRINKLFTECDPKIREKFSFQSADVYVCDVTD